MSHLNKVYWNKYQQLERGFSTRTAPQHTMPHGQTLQLKLITLASKSQFYMKQKMGTPDSLVSALDDQRRGRRFKSVSKFLLQQNPQWERWTDRTALAGRLDGRGKELFIPSHLPRSGKWSRWPFLPMTAFQPFKWQLFFFVFIQRQEGIKPSQTTKTLWHNTDAIHMTKTLQEAPTY